MRSRGQIEHDDAGRMIGRAGAKYSAVATNLYRAELCERRLEWPQHLAFQIKDCKFAEPALSRDRSEHPVDGTQDGLVSDCRIPIPDRYQTIALIKVDVASMVNDRPRDIGQELPD